MARMPTKLTQKQISTFRKKIWGFYRLHGRHDLPFRKTKNPYRIAVAEIMLQQTQVDRVVPKYQNWIREFPSWKTLAHASRQNILRSWSGLGYNRRAIFLQRMALTITKEYKGRLPKNPKDLLGLPGIGPYTSKSIFIFAFNAPLATVDTNIRRVFIHEFNLPAHTSFATLEHIAKALVPAKRSRDWHNALMDYAALGLPQTPRIQPLSRQSRFKGSIRQIRGEIIRRLTTHKHISMTIVARDMKRPITDVKKAAASLHKEHLINRRGSILTLSSNA
ncbi:MAG: Fe-S cluster assembly protein HesB [Patescibacteria group bacterium]|jgi:A/G-specific adenine glycosylase